MSKEVIIIGGGLGGLFTGALLARENYVVTVLEKNGNIGGGLQCFVRKGEVYETGMHVLGGLVNGGSLNKICSYLGIFDKLSIIHTDKDCMDEIYYYKTGEKYKIPSGKDNFINYFSNLFPSEKDGIKAYVNFIYSIANEFDLFCLREEKENTFFKLLSSELSADELIASFVKDSKLRDVLAYMNPLYGGVPGHSPAYIHALINVLYINGSSFFKGGSDQLAYLLKGVIESAGGKVIAGEKVVAVNVENKKVISVDTESGKTYVADYYISAICTVSLTQIITKGTFNKSFINRVEGLPTSYSAFIVYIKFKKNTFRYINHVCYYHEDYGSIWSLCNENEDEWPKGFLYVTPPIEEQGEYASHLTVNCVMDYKLVDKWSNTKSGNRGNDYEEWKKIHTEKIIGKLENIYPDIRDCIEYVFSASPLTVRDYYGVKNGAIYGIFKDAKDLLMSKITVFTKVGNLFFTGQNINLHGICGVPLTAVQTAEAIVGKNIIVKKINNYNK